MTDVAIIKELGPDTIISWYPNDYLPMHPNGMKFIGLDKKGFELCQYVVYSVGGGALVDENQNVQAVPGSKEAEQWNIYKNITRMNELMVYCEKNNIEIHQYVYECEGEKIKEHLRKVWDTMKATLERGLSADGILPGGLQVVKKAKNMYLKSKNPNTKLIGTGKRNLLTFSYALAAMEENASGNEVTTAPTLGHLVFFPPSCDI